MTWTSGKSASSSSTSMPSPSSTRSSLREQQLKVAEVSSAKDAIAYLTKALKAFPQDEDCRLVYPAMLAIKKMLKDQVEEAKLRLRSLKPLQVQIQCTRAFLAKKQEKLIIVDGELVRLQHVKQALTFAIDENSKHLQELQAKSKAETIFMETKDEGEGGVRFATSDAYSPLSLTANVGCWHCGVVNWSSRNRCRYCRCTLWRPLTSLSPRLSASDSMVSSPSPGHGDVLGSSRSSLSLDKADKADKADAVIANHVQADVGPSISPFADGWESVAIPPSIRRPWCIFEQDMEDREWRKSLAMIRRLGARAAFAALPGDRKSKYIEISRMELAAFAGWRSQFLRGSPSGVAREDEAWDSLDEDEKAAWIPEDPDVVLSDPVWSWLAESV